MSFQVLVWAEPRGGLLLFQKPRHPNVHPFAGRRVGVPRLHKGVCRKSGSALKVAKLKVHVRKAWGKGQDRRVTA